MKLLVTGGAGFIGSHVVRLWLTRRPSDELINLDLLTYAGSQARLADVEQRPNYRFIQADICDPGAVERAIDGCELVIHCAAETHVDRSITNAVPFLRTNVEGTHVLLRAAQASSVKRFIHLSTDEIYGPVPTGAVDERAPLSPSSPYAASKAAADLLAQAFWKTHGLPVIVVRPTNIFGPAQFPEKFIPLCIANGLDGLRLPIYGDGRQRRAWLFVADMCEALQVIVERGEVGQAYNVAGGTEQANLDTARMILAALGRSPELVECVADRPGHDVRYAMDDRKLRALGWRPEVAFDRALTETVGWYRKHESWWRPLARKLREDPYHWLNRPAGSGAREPSGTIR